MTFPAITVLAPWSWAIAEAAALRALGAKPKGVENRGRRVADKYLGEDIAIHASLRWDQAGAEDERILRAWRAFSDGIGCCRPSPHPALAAIGDRRTGCVGHGGPAPGLWIDQGAVVAVATPVDCHQSASFAPSVLTCCQPWGDSYHGAHRAWHLVLDNVRRLDKPVPTRGRQAVPWILPPDVEAAVRARLNGGAA